MKHITSRAPPSDDGAVDLSQRSIRKQEFGRRLYKIMLDKRLNQSDIARLSGLGRDSVSQYIRGRSVPTPQNLEKLAEALNLQPNDLFPNYAAQAVISEQPTFQIKSVEHEPESMWLIVNTKVSAVKAVQIMQILNDKD